MHRLCCWATSLGLWETISDVYSWAASKQTGRKGLGRGDLRAGWCLEGTENHSPADRTVGGRGRVWVPLRVP